MEMYAAGIHVHFRCTPVKRYVILPLNKQERDEYCMNVREHVKLSAVAALLASPWLQQEVAIPFAASLLIDVDHYAWHAVTRRTLSLRAAMRYFGQADPPQLQQMRVLHHPVLLGLLLLIAVRTRSRLLWLVLSGLLFHVSLDAVHGNRMGQIGRASYRERV